MTAMADVLVIGGGMAGASVAAELAVDRKVTLLEAEDRPGHHSTGRSAAIFVQNYGNAAIRQLSKASRPLLESPPFDPEGGSMLSPRGILMLANRDEEADLEELLRSADGLEELTIEEALARVPILRAEGFVRAAFEADAMDIDVDRLHQSYLRAVGKGGSGIVCNARVTALKRAESAWAVETTNGAFAAPVVVNASGAWADTVAGLAGLAPLGLKPLRRSAAILPAPEGSPVDDWPLFGDVEETWYAKPTGGKLMVSPADETPVEPHDAWPEDIDLAHGIDRFAQATRYEVTRVERTWAGLRTFAPDRTHVIGFDPAAEGFFWLAGQGGYGIQTAPAAAQLGASLIRGAALSPGLAEASFLAASVDPARFRS